MIPIPIVAENIWPSIAFRGCANGESIVWNSRIAAAPYMTVNRIFFAKAVVKGGILN